MADAAENQPQEQQPQQPVPEGVAAAGPHHGNGPQKPKDKEKGPGEAAAPVKPGLAAVQALQGGGEAAAGAVVKEIHEHPDERDDIMKWLQQHRGNAFVQEVTKHLGQVEKALPPGVELKSARASFVIPGKRKLSGDWTAAVSTREATHVTIEVTHTGVRITMSPSLFVDAQWPLQNANLMGAHINFADGKAHADVEDGHGVGSGMWSIKDKVAGCITSMLEKGIHNSPLAKPGYDPTQDADLGSTLGSVETGFQALFGGESDGAKKSKSPLTDKEMTDVQAGGTVTMKAGGSFMKDGCGLKLDAGSDLSLDAIGAGNVHDVASAGTAQDAAKEAHLTSLRIGASGLTVVSGGQPIAKISELSILPGGAVKIEQMQLLGKAAKAKAGEAGLSLLIAVLAIAGHDQSAGDFAHNAQDPQIVDGVTRALLEQNFTEQVKKMVLQYRTAVPGMDIAKLLSIG